MVVAALAALIAVAFGREMVVLLIVAVLLLAIVKVAAVAGAVNVTLLIVVAVATPKIGVTKVGDVAKTAFPVPVIAVEVIFPLAS